MFREPISAVTVSVGYGDFLAAVAPYNSRHLDKWVVVTNPKDEETREVCRRHGMTCLVTEDNDRDGKFSKGRLIERGLQMLPAEGWTMHLDADIVLPATFRHALERADLDPAKLYGCDRFMVKSYESWQALVKSGWPLHSFHGHPHCLMPPPGFEVGARWVGSDGWVPIGFLQLWNRLGGQEEWRGARVKPYPLSHGTAARTDVHHAQQWDRGKRELLAELFVAHLESEKATVGANWTGRTTKRFGAASPPGPSPAPIVS